MRLCRNNSGDNGSGSRQSKSYQPTFEHPHHSATVTHFIANFSEVTTTRDQNNWIIDSAVNAYTDSYKNVLCLYVEEHIDKIRELERCACNSTRQRVNHLTRFYRQKNHHPQQCLLRPWKILSLMKFRREYYTNFHFTDLEIFIRFSTDWRVDQWYSSCIRQHTAPSH